MQGTAGHAHALTPMCAHAPTASLHSPRAQPSSYAQPRRVVSVQAVASTSGRQAHRQPRGASRRGRVRIDINATEPVRPLPNQSLQGGWHSSGAASERRSAPGISTPRGVGLHVVDSMSS
jgi:hypothetical protein